MGVDMVDDILYWKSMDFRQFSSQAQIQDTEGDTVLSPFPWLH